MGAYATGVLAKKLKEVAYKKWVCVRLAAFKRVRTPITDIFSGVPVLVLCVSP